MTDRNISLRADVEALVEPAPTTSPAVETDGLPVDPTPIAQHTPFDGALSELEAMEAEVKARDAKGEKLTMEEIHAFREKLASVINTKIKGNSLYADLKKMQKEYPYYMGKHVHLKHRVSKTRNKKK